MTLTRRNTRVRLRGDDIPPVRAYAHWGEDAEAVWYLENKYDMEHWDEPMEDDNDNYWDVQEDDDE